MHTFGAQKTQPYLNPRQATPSFLCLSSLGCLTRPVRPKGGICAIKALVCVTRPAIEGMTFHFVVCTHLSSPSEVVLAPFPLFANLQSKSFVVLPAASDMHGGGGLVCRAGLMRLTDWRRNTWVGGGGGAAAMPWLPAWLEGIKWIRSSRLSPRGRRGGGTRNAFDACGGGDWKSFFFSFFRQHVAKKMGEKNRPGQMTTAQGSSSSPLLSP